MSILREQSGGSYTSVRERTALNGRVGWRKLGLIAFSFYLVKGLCWIAVGYIALGR